MVDTRFHAFAGPIPLRTLLAEAAEESSTDDERMQFLVVAGADELGLAGPHDIALAANRHYAADLEASRAGGIIVGPDLAGLVPPGSIAIVSDRPHELFAELLDRLYPEDTRAVATVAGAHQPALEADVIVGPNVVFGPNVEIGRGTVIGANTVIGAGVAIGRDCVIGANCSIDCAYLGNEVVVHAGARIGTEGFGWLELGRANRKIPQLGRVIVQDRVEVGANAAIDRGALGDTVIGEGTKIDNLVQIGHNCRIGRSCLIAATTGLSGSTVLGDGVLLGGGVGTSGHLTIGAGSIVHGRAAVTKDWPPGSKLAGAPAQDIRDFWKELAVVRRLSKRERG